MKKQLITLFGLFFITTVTFALEEQCADRIRVHAPYVRLPIPGQHHSAIFMTLENTGGTHCALVNALSPVAGAVELHTHAYKDGVFKMRQIENIPLEPLEVVELKPGGLHIMLINLKEKITENTAIPVTLIYSDQSQDIWYPPVKKLIPKESVQHKHRY